MNMPIAQVIGHLHLLWWWALDNAPNGSLTGLDDGVISMATGYEHRLNSMRTRFVQELRNSGWLDGVSGDYSIHGWDEYAGVYIEKKAADAQRKRDERLAKSSGHPKDVHRTSEGRRSDGAGTVPNRTLPNQTNIINNNIITAWKETTGKTPLPAILQTLISFAEDYTEQVLIEAMKQASTTTNGNFNIKYLRSVLENWGKEKHPTVKGNGQKQDISPDEYIKKYSPFTRPSRQKVSHGDKTKK